MRKHETPLGHLPSVTTILSLTRSKADSEKLRKWQHKFDKINGVGAADKYSDEAKNKGTIIHKLIEMQLQGKPLPDCYDYPEILMVKGFLQTLDIISLETTVYHPSGYSGIADCVAKIDNQPVLIDWKTSKREKRKSWITDYFIQTAAYSQAWNYLSNDLKIENLLIVILGPKLQLFEGTLTEYLPLWENRLIEFRSGNFC